MKYYRLISFLLLLLLPFYLPVNAQISGTKTFVYLPNEYQFCYLNAELGIQLPEGWGFQVPFLNEYESELSLHSGKVIYSLSTHTIEKPFSFFFTSPENSFPLLELQLTIYGYDTEKSTTISSDFGDFHLAQPSYDNIAESYQMIRDSYVITFRILTTNAEEREICKSIIASTKYCDHYKSSDNDYISNHYFTFEKGDSIYYPNLGLLIRMPLDLNDVIIYGKKIRINNTQTVLINQLTLKELGTTYSEFISLDDDFRVTCYLLDNTEDLFSELAYPDEDYYRSDCWQTFSYPIDGILSKFYLHGPAFSPRLLVDVPTENYHLVLDFENIMVQSVENIVSFLLDISIDSIMLSVPKTSLGDKEELIQMLNIKPISAFHDYFASLTPHYVEQKKKKNAPLLTCKFPELNAELYFPYFEKTIEQKERIKYDKKTKTYQIELSLSSSLDDYWYTKEDDSFSFSIPEWNTTCATAITRREELLQNDTSFRDFILKTFYPYSCSSELQVERMGVFKIKENQWYVISVLEQYEGEKVHFYLLEYKDMVIIVTIMEKGKIKASSDFDSLYLIFETLLQKSNFP